MDLTISAVNSGTASAQSSTATTSVGITVLKHWNKVMQVNAFIAQLANDVSLFNISLVSLLIEMRNLHF